MKPQEIRALARLLDRMDYYRLLRLEPDAGPGQIRSSYHRMRREFNPDGYLHEEPAVRHAVDRIAKRITEAYLVVRDAVRRKAYDDGLASGALRVTAETEESARAATAAPRGKTPNGRRFFSLAEDAQRAGDLAAAVGHLKTALTFEPGNENFKARLEKLNAAVPARSAASGYAIR